VAGRHRRTDELDEPTGELAVVVEATVTEDPLDAVGCGCGCGSCDGGDHCHNDIAGCTF
jgi:hypothetical protein